MELGYHIFRSHHAVARRRGDQALVIRNGSRASWLDVSPQRRGHRRARAVASSFRSGTMSTSGTGATMANEFPLLKTEVKAQSAPALASADAKMSVDCLDAYYGKRLAVDKVTMPFREKLITAIIGPSGAERPRCFAPSTA